MTVVGKRSYFAHIMIFGIGVCNATTPNNCSPIKTFLFARLVSLTLCLDLR